MSIDMSQFYQVFFEESAEHLASMESLLLALDLDSPDPDQLNAIFRAAHSIKGSSGTFGFTDMTEVTHELETLLDLIRKNEIAITADMVDTFLQAGDVLHSMLDAHQSGAIIDNKVSIEIRARLLQLTAKELPRFQETGFAQEAPLSVSPGVGTAAAPAEFVPASAMHTFQLHFPNTSIAFPNKDHLGNLLEELGKIGKIGNKQIAAETMALLLTTSASEEEVRDIFYFFLKPEQLSITESDIAIHGTEQQDYGLFVDPETVKSAVENVRGYGFFVDPDNVKSEIENAQGYGFFVDPDNVKSEIENTQGYGFFEEVGNFAQPQVSQQRLRQNDLPGRRDTDSAAVSTAGESSIRVRVAKVDQMINLVGELVITQSMLKETVSSMDQVLHERLVNGLGQLERNTRDLQDSVMSVRMMPINLVFNRFQRMVRDGSAKMGKKVQLKIIGESTELDKGLIEKISDPLNHLVRNSLDHGIEFPEERIANGKAPVGTITLRAAHQGGNIVIEVSDDGSGLDRDRILAKAREKGMLVNESMSDAEVSQIIYAPGFSTAATITEVSGRGVGMDVVKRNIESLGGRVEISSHRGQGCIITIRLPLTLAILDGLSISVGDQIFIIPLNFIVESLQPKPEDIKEISGQGQVVHVREEYLPLIALHKLFNIQTRIINPAEGILVLLETEGKKVALFVDELVGQHQVVIKSLESNYRKVPGVSGATIMGDGRVALIMDVGALVKLV